MTIIIISVALITLQIWREINEISKDIQRLNKICKMLQAANGMIADGIDKAGK